MTLLSYRAPGFVNFVLALAYHFWLNFPAAFTQPGARLLVEPCTYYALSNIYTQFVRKFWLVLHLKYLFVAWQI